MFGTNICELSENKEQTTKVCSLFSHLQKSLLKRIGENKIILSCFELNINMFIVEFGDNTLAENFMLNDCTDFNRRQIHFRVRLFYLFCLWLFCGRSFTPYCAVTRLGFAVARYMSAL